MKLESKDTLFHGIKDLLHQARTQIVQTVNSAMVMTYFEIGKLIVKHEQKGNAKATYGEGTLKDLSTRLTHEFGKGFSVTNLQQMRAFFIAYQKQQTPSVKSKNILDLDPICSFTLSWSHYVFLIRLDENARKFYEIEATQNNWSLKELERQFNTALYDRLRLSKDKDGVKSLNKKGQVITQPSDAIKDPYILEFLGLEEKTKYSESQLEQAIIDKIEHFLLELGKGFSFVGRQQRFSFGEEHFFVDLVFYNRLLRCFVLIDLKIGKIKHQDLGQLQMYVNYYDRFVKTVDENKTIGIILCNHKKSSIVEISLPENNQQIFASNYQLYLPTKDEFKAQLDKVLDDLEADTPPKIK